MPCLVMQLVCGGSLDRLIRVHGPLSWKRAARYVSDIASGLARLHEKGIVHRDIKPDNMLLDAENDEALLTDLGIAARLSESPADSVGTLPYMSPEAFDGHVSPALDVYALAASLFALMTGSFPFASGDPIAIIAACQDGLPEGDPRLAGVPGPLEALIRAGLAAEMSRRPSLTEFSARLRGTLNALLADGLATGGTGVRLVISRREGREYRLLAASTPASSGTLRDVKVVPATPGSIRLETGDIFRIEVEADRAGHVTVFNVGPTGNLTPLSAENAEIRPGERPHVADVQLSPPTGRERLFALWTAGKLPLRLEEMRSLVEQAGTPTAGAYRATRDLARVQETVSGLPVGAYSSAVIEIEHVQPVGQTT
jgi:hypothetical protein